MGQDDRKPVNPDGGQPDPIADAALNWLVALQSGAVDPQTRADFERWRASDPRHAQAYAKLAKAWDMPELHQASRKVAADLYRTGAIPRMQPTPISRARRWRMPAAAAAIVLIALGATQYPALMLRLQSDYITATGDQRTVMLPDGSTMTLNTASAVALDFTNDHRTVRLLQGEAYFDVVHDPTRPFRVINRFSQVQDIGTAFDVRTASAEDEIVLERGLADVRRLTNTSDSVRLNPGYGATANATGLSQPQRTDVADALAWREGRYVFNEQPFGKVLGNLRRYYNGSIFVLNGDINSASVSGSYRLSDPVGAIRSLAHVAGVSMTVLPGGIIVLR